ncbi:MAG: hypothetical protein V2A73_18165, partial [Pseudomonadota bacterium]
MDCRRAQRVIERSFIEGDDLAAKPRLHVAECPSCRRLYDLLFAAQAQLACGDRPAAASSAGGTPDGAPSDDGALAGGLTAPEKDLLCLRVLPPPLPPHRRIWRFLGLRHARPVMGPVVLGSTAALAGLLMLVGLRWPGASPPAERFAARSFATPRGDSPAHASAPTGLRAVCLVQGPDGFTASAIHDRRPAHEPPTCTIRDYLGFGYRNETGAQLHLGIAVHGRSGWVVVVPGDDGSVRAVPTTEERPEEPLDAAVPLAGLG